MLFLGLAIVLLGGLYKLLDDQADQVHRVRRRLADDYNESRLLFKLQSQLTELHYQLDHEVTAPELADQMEPRLRGLEDSAGRLLDHAEDDVSGREGEQDELEAIESLNANLQDWRQFQSSLQNTTTDRDEVVAAADHLYAQGSEAILRFSEGAWRELDASLSELRSSENHIESLTLYGTIGLGLLVLTGWISFAYWLLSPLRRLRHMVRRVRSRDFAIEEKPRREPREVGELMTSFVRMARELDAFTRELEERVADRTIELEQERRRLKLIIDRLPDAVGLSDAQGALLVCNSSYERLLGSRSESRAADVASSEATPQGYRRHVAPSGETHLLDVRVYPLEEGDASRADAVQLEHLRDMTRLYDVEAALATSQKLAAIGRLASGIAHEINNPMTAIAACAEGLQRRLASPTLDRETFAEYLEIVRSEVFRCKEITEKLLDLARPRRERPKRFLATEPVESTLRLLEPLAERRNVRIEMQPCADSDIVSDRRSVEQVVLNLLLNAIEASDDGGVVSISYHPTADRLEIRVADQGNGIAPEDLPRLFEPFFTRRHRKDSGGSGAVGGTGLGLFVCQGLADALGGSIEADSRGVGQGSTFSFCLPRRLVPEEPRGAKSAESRDAVDTRNQSLSTEDPDARE